MRDDIILTRISQLDWQNLPGGFKYRLIAIGDKFRPGWGLPSLVAAKPGTNTQPDVEETYLF